MPMATMATPSAAEASAARAIRVAIPRPIMGRTVGVAGRRAVADPADGRHVARVVGVVAELVAQAPDVDVDGPVQHVRLVPAVDRVEELVAGEHPAVRLEDGLEQPELDPGQGDRRAVAGDLVAVEVHDQVAVDERRAASPARPRTSGPRGGGST